MKTYVFRDRVAMLLGQDFGIQSYGECRLSPTGDSWVEVTVSPLKKEWSKSCAYVPLALLKKMAALFATEDLIVTGFDIDPACEGREYVAYILAHGVKFP